MKSELLKDGDFDIHVFGEGEPKLFVAGGASFVPEDFTEVTIGTLVVPNNPVHAGTIKRTNETAIWLRTQYQRIFEEQQCTAVMGHSSGCKTALFLADIHPEIQKTVLLSFPSSLKVPPTAPEGRNPNYGVLDLMMTEISRDLTDEAYEDMLKRHSKTYGATSRGLKEMCKNDILNEQARAALVEQLLRCRHQILVLIGDTDPWCRDFPEKMPDNITVERLEGAGHFPHLSQAETVSKKIKKWLTPKENPVFSPQPMEQQFVPQQS